MSDIPRTVPKADVPHPPTFLPRRRHLSGWQISKPLNRSANDRNVREKRLFRCGRIRRQLSALLVNLSFCANQFCAGNQISLLRASSSRSACLAWAFRSIATAGLPVVQRRRFLRKFSNRVLRIFVMTCVSCVRARESRF
jgi:hypothetical protein